MVKKGKVQTITSDNNEVYWNEKKTSIIEQIIEIKIK
jgi:hypothetical protein